MAATPNLNPLDRALLLLNYYLFGPIFGSFNHLIVPDRKLSAPERFVTQLAVALIIATTVYSSTPPLIKLGLTLILLPILVYSLANIQQLILEYRVYLSTFGYALIAGYISTISYLAPIPITILFFYITWRRNHVYQTAESFWKQASRDCDDPAVLSNYVYALYKRSNFSQIDDIYTEILAKHIPECRTLLINMAAAKFGSTQIGDRPSTNALLAAKDILVDVTKRWPDQGDGWRNLATIYYYLGDIPASVTSFGRALHIDPKDGLSYMGLGECCFYTQEYSAAADYFKHALRLNPHLLEIRTRLMEALELSGNTLEFAIHNDILKSEGMLYVTDDMLPGDIRTRREP